MSYGKIKEQYETGFMSYDDFIFYVETIIDELDLSDENDKERYEYIKSDLKEMF